MRAEDREALLEALDDRRLERLLNALRDFVRRRGHAPQSIRIESADEADALHGLIGGKPLPVRSISLKTVEERLMKNSRFKCTVRELLDARFGVAETVPQTRSREAGEWREAAARLQSLGSELAPERIRADVLRWMQSNRADLKRRYNRYGLPRLESDLRGVIAALAALPAPGGRILLSELAQRATGDSHAFDAGTPAGSLLDRVLASWYPEAVFGRRGSARWRRRLLTAGRIERDSITSRVDTFGLLVGSPAPPPPDPLGLDRTWTLRALRRLPATLHAAHGVAFVFENPTVYESVLELVMGLERDFDPTLVCTSGQLNLADDLLIDRLVESGATLFYSGDFDPEGLQIALDLRDRHPDRVRLWRYDPADYRAGIREQGPKLEVRRLARARAALPALVEAMCAEGYGVHQEALIDTLFDDVARFVRAHTLPPSASPMS